MRIKVDQIKCSGTGICVRECPEVFRFLEGSKKATVILDEIPVSLLQKCMGVVEKCPNNAITITK